MVHVGAAMQPSETGHGTRPQNKNDPEPEVPSHFHMGVHPARVVLVITVSRDG
jgi:hypothetical protein